MSLCLGRPAWSADGPVVWEPAQVLGADKIAKSGDTRVPLKIVRLAIPLTFDNFRYPFLQPDQSIMFIANDQAGSGRAGIYRITANGELSLLVEEGASFSNADMEVTCILGLRVDDSGRAVFRCGLNHGGTGIGMWEDGSLVLLAQTGDESGFEQLGYPGLSGQIVTFLALRDGEAGELYAIDLESSPRVPRKIADTSTPIPGHLGKKFGSFGYQEEADGENAIFRGFEAGVDEHFDRALSVGGVYRKNIRSNDPPRKIIDTTTPLPGAPAGATFTELQNAIPWDGTVVVPSYSKESSGIYYVGLDGKPQLVADTYTQMPDLFKGPFTGFSKWAVNCSPWVIFRGYAEDNYEGLFAMNMERNELLLLLDTRTEFDGKKISGFEYGSRSKFDENLVLAIKFADKTSGVYQIKFGDGWGKAVFRRDAYADVEIKPEITEEGSFRMLGKHYPSLSPGAAAGKATSFDEAELIESAQAFPARKGLNFGYRYTLSAPGKVRRNTGEYDLHIIHPPMEGSDGKLHTRSTTPTSFSFTNGKADGWVIYCLEEDFEVLPGKWTLQLRKDGKVLLSRSFNLL